MKPTQPGIMTPDKYLQTDEATLLEIAPHWRLLQVFPREPKKHGYKCGAMFYIGVELEGRTSGTPDMANLLYGGPCLEETALALSALIPLMPGAKLVVIMMRHTKSQEGHHKHVIWQATRSHDSIRAIRESNNLDDLMENVGLRNGDKTASTNPYFVLPYSISNNGGMKQAEYGFHTYNPYGTAIELLLRGKEVGAIVRVMKWSEKRSVYRRNRFIKLASANFPSKPMRETIHDIRIRQYDERSRVGEYGAW